MSYVLILLNKKTESSIKNWWKSSFVEDRRRGEDSEGEKCFEENVNEIVECIDEEASELMDENNIDIDDDIPVCAWVLSIAKPYSRSF